MTIHVDVDRARRLLRDGALLVDVLPASVYAKVHLPGAVNVPLESFDARSVEGLDPDRALLIYCFDQH